MAEDLVVTGPTLLPRPTRVRNPATRPDACCTAPIATTELDDCCAGSAPRSELHDRHATTTGTGRDADWLRRARLARILAWASLLWMSLEGAFGLAAGIRAGSIGLVGWALSSVVEGLASLIVIWRFTGSRTHSPDAERTAQRAVAISFWLLAPYVAVQSVIDLAGAHRPSATTLGVVLTISSLILMPALGIAKRRLGARLGSDSTAGEGSQNLLCAYLAAAVLFGLVTNTTLGWWWLDPIAGLAVALIAVIEGRRTWQGEDCC
jgi:divalent metal cation (Fe/Co/Zn/Cd) transporter